MPRTAFNDSAAPKKGVGPPPPHMHLSAQAYYTQLAALLTDRLSAEDENTLATCAQALAEIEIANADLKVNHYTYEGPQGTMPSPWIAIREKAHKRFESCSKALGLSPADRYRMAGGLTPPEAGGGPADFDKDHGGDSA